MRRAHAHTLVLTLALTACSDDSSSSTPSPDGAVSSVDAKVAIDAAPGTGPDAATSAPDASAAPTPDAASGATFNLTIANQAVWCDITANGSPFPANGQPTDSATMPFPQHSVVNLRADPVSATFEWGFWTGTSNVHDGKDRNQSTTITLDANLSITVCCPIVGHPDCTTF